jgi:hypothetical protein
MRETGAMMGDGDDGDDDDDGTGLRLCGKKVTPWLHWPRWR